MKHLLAFALASAAMVAAIVGLSRWQWLNKLWLEDQKEQAQASPSSTTAQVLSSEHSHAPPVTTPQKSSDNTGIISNARHPTIHLPDSFSLGGVRYSLGMSSEEFTQTFGKPDRISPPGGLGPKDDQTLLLYFLRGIVVALNTSSHVETFTLFLVDQPGLASWPFVASEAYTDRGIGALSSPDDITIAYGRPRNEEGRGTFKTLKYGSTYFTFESGHLANIVLGARP